MLVKRYTSLMLAALGLLALTSSVRAGEGLFGCGRKEKCGPSCDAQPCPAPACEEQIKKTCIPTVTKKTVEKPAYSSRCIDFCVPRCTFRPSGLFNKKSCGGCDGCGEPAPCDDCPNCHHCGKVRTKKVLIVRIKKKEECVHGCEVVNECVPACAPAPCAPACGGCAPGCAKTIVIVEPTQPAEKLPVKPMPVDPMKK